MYKPFLFLVITIATLISCSKTIIPYDRTGEVNAVSHENSIVVVRSQGRAENPGKAVYHAERNAFENLLFKGIPNTNQESPMIPNETAAMSKHKATLSELLANQGYVKYIMDSYTGNSSKSGGVVAVEQVIKIDLRALRNNLENEGITKKFGL